jgi:phosphomannomutase
MDKIFIFDVDGTLTPSRQPMTKEFQKFFKEWVKTNKFYLVTGSDISKLQEQMCMYDIEAERIFTCCGNEMWVPDPHIVNISAYQEYRKEFKPSKKLTEYLELELKFSPYKKQYGNHIEDRGTLLNFSVVGRDCNQEQREDYNRYDTEKGERKRITEVIKRQFPELDAVIGGQISIDIYPKGNDKSQILEHIEKRHPKGEIIFIGDGIENGGNDYPLAHLMDNLEGCDWYHTKGWKETQKILKELND